MVLQSLGFNTDRKMFAEDAFLLQFTQSCHQGNTWGLKKLVSDDSLRFTVFHF